MLLMTIFVFDLVHRQREFLLERAKSRVLFQAELLAANSLHGAMSNDMAALSEIINALAQDEDVTRAMVTDGRGRVLAHTDTGKVGLFRSDPRTLAVLNGTSKSTLVDEEGRSLEAAAPILAQNRVIGWTWVSRDLGTDQAHLSYVTHAGLVYTAAAILIGTTFAFLLAGIVTRQLRLLLAGTKRMAANRLDQEVAVTTENEVGQVARAFNCAMHKLSEQQAALRESEKQFREMAEGIPQLAWMANPDGGIYWYNQRWYQYTGTTPPQMEGWGWQSVHDPSELPKVLERWKNSIATGETFDMVFPLRGADGVFRPFLTRVMPLRDAQGRVVRWFGTNTDISAQKQAEQALLRSEKLASVGRMAATIAHEINNPLAAVTNTLYLARTNADHPDSLRQYLDSADEELRRIAYITRQALGFYRESNAPARMSVNAVLESSVDLLKGKIKVKHAVIEKQWVGDVEVTAIAGELRQVFSNLLANSLDAIDEQGTIKLRVSTGAAFNNGHRCVRVTVADNGKGIDATSRDRIFEPFFTTKGMTGTGLGLWVSKQIIDKHGGTIRMRSSTNGTRRGTAFTIALPMQSAAAHSLSAGA
jgi:PAS domain S-box-containing protein